MSPTANAPAAPSCLAVIRRAIAPRKGRSVVYTIDVRSIPSTPFARETFARREDAESFVEEVRRGNPDLASTLRIEERDLTAHPAPHRDLQRAA